MGSERISYYRLEIHEAVMDRLQIIYPYYENPTMLHTQLETWKGWANDLKKKTKIILVDDGSQHANAATVIQGHGDIGIRLDLYNILINIPWNQNGAHNLGFHVADDGWCLTTDIDHVVVEQQLRRILSLPTNSKCYYSFGRRQVRAPNTSFKRHPNSWLLTRKMFLESGGYDEDFAGYYGSDSCFRRALTLVGRHIPLPDSCYLTVYDQHDITDANTREWGRKDSKYHSANYPELAKKRGRTYKAENPLRFPWEKVI
jgi:hypothetical protein